MIRAVVFDMDGTLTKPFLNFRLIRDEIGVSELGASLLDQITAMPADEKARALSILARHEAAAVENAELNEGVLDLFAELKRLNLLTAVVTRNSSRSTFAALSKLNLKVNRVITRDSGLPIKPDPAPLLALAREWGIMASEMMMTGDFRYDIECGRAAGTLTCLVTNGRDPADAAGADYVVARPGELRCLLADLQRPGSESRSGAGKGGPGP